MDCVHDLVIQDEVTCSNVPHYPVVPLNSLLAVPVFDTYIKIVTETGWRSLPSEVITTSSYNTYELTSARESRG